MTRLRSLALMGICVASSGAWAAVASAECKLAAVAEIPVVMEHRRILIPSEIDGQKVFFILDTGGSATLFAGAAQRLGLSTHNTFGNRLYGVGGEIQFRTAQLQSLKLGPFDLRAASITVAGGRPSKSSDIVGFIGYDVFARYDMEFDLAHKMVRLVKSPGCSDDQMDYWRAPYAVAPLNPHGSDDTHSYVQVQLNGVPVEATLDTGSPTTVVDLPAAERAGVKPGSSGVVEIGTMSGVAGTDTPVWLARFHSFELGEEKIANPTIAIADMFRRDTTVETGSHVPVQIFSPQMLLGLDFFMAHRVLISREHQKVYFSYNGGPIFEPPHLKTTTSARPDAAQPVGPPGGDPPHPAPAPPGG